MCCFTRWAVGELALNRIGSDCAKEGARPTEFWAAVPCQMWPISGGFVVERKGVEGQEWV